MGLNHVPDPSDDGREVTVFALTLLENQYTIGGEDSAAGLDYLKQVQFSFKEAVGKTLTGRPLPLPAKAGKYL